MKKSMHLFGLLLLILSNQVLAACTSQTSDGKDYYVATATGFNPPEFNPNSVPIGGVIYRKTITPSGFVNKKNSTATVQCNPASTYYVAGFGTPDAGKIYPTSIPNIGMRISSSNYVKVPYPVISISNTSWGEFFSATIELIKTGEITAGGLLSEAYVAYRADSTTGPLLVEYRFASPVVVQPRVPTCKVATPSILVPLGNVLSSSFKGAGSTAGRQPFNIALTCSGGDPATSTNAYVTLTDATRPDNTSTTLSPTKESTATGIGLQVLRGETVLGYGPDSAAVGNTNQWKAGTITQGMTGLNIPLSVQYVQTGSSVTPGTADARATFTMSYQ